jgi:hypothetical protein
MKSKLGPLVPSALTGPQEGKKRSANCVPWYRRAANARRFGNQTITTINPIIRYVRYPGGVTRTGRLNHVSGAILCLAHIVP